MKNDIQYFISRLPILAMLALLAFILGTILGERHAHASERSELVDMAHRSKLYVSDNVLNTIVKAAHKYDISSKEIFTIAIIESNLNPNAFRTNSNGTLDLGIMQINTINRTKCMEYNINTLYGNVFCSAKLIASLKLSYPSDYLGRYHSATPKYKNRYISKVSKVLYSSVNNVNN